MALPAPWPNLTAETWCKFKPQRELSGAAQYFPVTSRFGHTVQQAIIPPVLTAEIHSGFSFNHVCLCAIRIALCGPHNFQSIVTFSYYCVLYGACTGAQQYRLRLCRAPRSTPCNHQKIDCCSQIEWPGRRPQSAHRAPPWCCLWHLH